MARDGKGEGDIRLVRVPVMARPAVKTLWAFGRYIFLMVLIFDGWMD